MADLVPSPLSVLTEDERMFRDAVAAFAREKVGPRVKAMEKAAQLDPTLIKEAFEMGLMGIEIPEQYGGQGGTFFQACLAVEEVAKVDGSLAVMIDVQNTLVINCLMREGTEDQKKRYLPKLASEWVASYCLSEAVSGSDAFALRCRAREDGDDFVLEGAKMWITSAAEASLFLVFATVNPDAGYKGITGFLVERSMPGFSVGKKEDKLGIRASSTCEIVLDGVRVPKTNVIGQVGKGYKYAIETLNEGRIGIGAQMLGIARGAFDAGIAYAKERKQFGKPISEFQAMQHQFAQAATELQAAKLLVYDAARRKDAKMGFLMEAAMAKLVASQTAERVTSRVVEWFGGFGFTTEYPAEKYFRDAKIGQIYEGTTNMQLNTIAKIALAEGIG